MDRLINRRDLDFLLYECLHTEALTGRERYAEHDRATFDAVIDAAQKLAVEMHVTPGQLALAWLLHQDIQVFPIVGALKRDHLADQLASAEVSLSPQRVGWLTGRTTAKQTEL